MFDTVALRRGFTAGLVLACVPGASQAQVRTVDADRLPVTAARMEIRIGHSDDPTRGFNRIRAVDVDRDGQIFVFDAQTTDLKLFARDGRYLRTIGRRGRGPGEFASRFGISVLGVAGDTVWTYETEGRRVNAFRRDGSLVESMTIPAVDLTIPIHAGAVGYVQPGFVERGGRFVSAFEPVAPSGSGLEAQRLANLGLSNRVRPSDTVMVPIVRFTPRSSRPDTIGRSPRPPDDVAPVPVTTTRGSDGRVHVGEIREVGGVSYGVPGQPWVHYLQVAMRDGSAIVHRLPASADTTSAFEVHRFDLTGNVAYRVRFTYKPRRYDDVVLDSLAMRQVTTSGEPNMAAFRAVRAAMKFPAFQSPIFSAQVASDGALWLRREWDGSNKHRWIVIAPNGAPRGVVTLPSSARVRWASRDVVLTEEPDENGVPWLVRYSLQR